MIRKKHILLFVLGFLAAFSDVRGDLVINEFLASNAAGLTDGFGEREDWIEIRNGGAASVDLAGYHLTDEADFLSKWTFPSAVIPAGGYLVVIASGRDLVDASGYIHTSFKLGRDGAYLALSAPDGVTVLDEFEPAYPEQFTDISYGIDLSAGGARRFFAIPTPAAPNGTGYEGVVKDTNFSVDRGFYDAPISVAITTATAGTSIRYTTDGTKPSETTGMLYAGSVAITNTTALRAIAYRAGWLSTDVDTHTYIFVDHVAQQPADPPGWPADWGPDPNVPADVIPSDYEMDPRVVNNTVTNYSVRDALLDIPSVSIAMLPADFIDADIGIYANPLSRWERECSVEYILPDGADGFQYNCKIEVHGNSSRNPYRMQKHSLRLTFTTEYGPAKLDYPLFADSAVEEFNQLVLRACFTDSWGLVSWAPDRYRPNDSLYIRDVWMKNSLRDMGQPSSHGNYVHLYVNGLYFGVHNLTERVSADFFADHLGGEPAEWEVNEDFSTPGSRWNAMMAVDPSTDAGYAQIQHYLDIDNLCDYMLLHFYADAEDWPHHNGYAAANPVSGDGCFRFFVWDQEIMLDFHGRAASKIDHTGGPGAVFQKLRTNSNFRMRFADRFYKHCFHGGALSCGDSQQRFLETAGMIDKAIVAESARWGDTQMSTPYGNTIEQPSPLDDYNHLQYPPAPNGPDYYFTREQSWLVERDNVISNYIPAIHEPQNSYALINLLRSKNLYPDIDPPEFNQNGGEVAASFGLVMTAVSGDIWYTLDGSDPRLPGGAVSSNATQFIDVPVFFSINPVTVRARALSGSEWSALHEAVFLVDTERARAGNLAVSEIHYNPAGSDDYEFLELQNIGPARILLEGVRITAAAEFTFGAIVLDPGAFVVVAEDGMAFTNRYMDAGSPYYHPSILLAGRWSGQLANEGERILLLDAAGETIQDFVWSDSGAWPGRADGRGSSLERVRPDVPPGQPEHWSAGALYHGSPGRGAEASPIVINEIMSHSDSGLDWVEFLNTGGEAIDIGGLYLSDDLDTPLKYLIPSPAVVAPGGFLVIDQSAFGVGVNAFSFSELGEEVSLVEAAGGNILRVVAFEDFGAAGKDITFGRFMAASGDAAFTTLSLPTPSATNAPPLIGPVVIGEIMYHPPEGKLEYIELVNTTDAPLELFSGTNTWRLVSAVNFPLPQGLTLPACGRLLLTESDPTTFRTVYDVPSGVPVYGPWEGRLDNDGESVRLQKPGDPEPDGTVPFITADRVDYRDYSPWPLYADGSGASLERLDLRGFGSDPYNWYASETSRGTPGSGPDPCSENPNRYPAISGPSSVAADEGALLSVQFQASDPDDGQQLFFSLSGAVPPGCSVTPEGLLTWTPTEDDGPGTFQFSVAVTDNGIPNLTRSQLLTVSVAEVNTTPDLLRGGNSVTTNTVPLIPFGSLWRYLDDGSDQGSAWCEPAFNDSSWAAGFARLGYGDVQNTTIGYGPDAAAKYPTTYFRHTFVAGMADGTDSLMIDFGQVGGPVQSGWQAYTAIHEKVSSFLPQEFEAFGTVITLNATWAAGAVDAAAQMYDRGIRPSDTPDLMRDWIGTDRRVTGNPLTITLSGVPPGEYNWLSYHHDTENQTGLFDVTVNDALGSITSTGIDITSGNLPFASVTTFSSVIISDGSDITLVFDKPPSGLVVESFFLMNAFKLTRRAYDISGTLAALKLKLVRDDGAIVYLNGVELVRDNMPDGAVDYLDFAADGVGGEDETTPHLFTLGPEHLVAGTNVLAVEIHQHTANSSDLGMDLELAADYTKGGPYGLTDYSVLSGELVRFVCSSVDADRPAQGITYSLAPGAPSGALVDPRTGLFSWTPGNGDGPAVVTITVIATDDAVPPLSDSESFFVTVYAPITSGDLRFENGSVIWRALPGEQYRVEYRDDLTSGEWQVLETRTATGTQESFSDPGFPVVRRRFYRIISLRFEQ